MSTRADLTAQTAGALHTAARLLAQMDLDQATIENGVGYSKSDGSFGHLLASTPPEAWSPDVVRGAYVMLRKYRGQLSGLGVDFDAIPSPPPGSERREVRAIDHDGERYVVRFSYNPDMISHVRALPGRRWSADERVWTAPHSQALLDFIDDHGFGVTERASRALTQPVEPTPDRRGYVEQRGPRLIVHSDYNPLLIERIRGLAGRRWDPEQKVWTVPMSAGNGLREIATDFDLDWRVVDDIDLSSEPTITLLGDRFIIRCTYDRDVVAQIREIPGAMWERSAEAWTLPLDASLDLLDFIVSTGASVDDIASQALTTVADAWSRVQASSATDAEIEIDGLGGDLLPFQRAGVRYALDALDYIRDDQHGWHRQSDDIGRGVFIADEMGLGKTVQALALIAATRQTPAVIICPTSLRLNWQREASRWIPWASSEILYGTRPRSTSADIQIVGYDVLHAWQETLDARIVILDESHLTKNGATRRAQATLRLADRCRESGGSVIALSGTPILSKPDEIVAQLRIIGRLDDFGGVRRFREDFYAERSLPSLNRRLRSTCYVRRRKADVLTELPPKRWARLVVEGTDAEMRIYRDAERDIIAYIAERARDLASQSGATDDQARREEWRAALRAEAAQHLVRITALRRLAVDAKMRSTRDWIAEFTETGKKLVVFGWHRDVVGRIAEEFAQGCRVQGQMSDAEKQDCVDRFQTDDDQRVISCSIRAAGVGLTLTASSDVLFVEQGWTPADMDQASDRCHRIGQHDSVTAWTVICADTIDEDIADLIDAKRSVVGAATDGVRVTDEETSTVLGDLLVRLAERAGV